MSDITRIQKELSEVVHPDIDRPVKLPSRNRVVCILKAIQVVLLPDYYHYKNFTVETALKEVDERLCAMIQEVLKAFALDKKPRVLCDLFMASLKDVKSLLYTDIQAIYDGDPAATSKAEIILCYPGFYATMIYRIAHVLYRLGIPFIPRVMSEYAHEKTGIDINPGACIGSHFCIDHGTGIVIGETATIGQHVKLYQGVTIGAKSFELDEFGHPLKGGKRHPDIGDDVVIYANATVLGGDTVVGDHSVIGSNVWLLHSVEPNTKLYYSQNQ